MKTNALVVEKPGDPWQFREINLDDNLQADEVLVQMKATGVCHTDLNFSKEETIPGLHPIVLGHEGAGIIIKIGSSVKNTKINDHVLLTYTCCNTCSYCDRKETSYCDTWHPANFGIGRLDGSKAFSFDSGEELTSHFFGQSSFASYAVVSASCCIVVDKDADLEMLAPLGCGIMTGAGAMLNVVKPKADSTVCVIGIGAVGSAALMSLNLLDEKPAKIVAVDIVPDRLNLAKRLGATDVINSRDVEDLRAKLLEVSRNGIHGSIDTTGRPDVINQLIKATAKRGIVVQVGVGSLQAETSINIFEAVNSGRMYTGCAMGSCYPQEFIPMLIEASKNGKFPFQDLIKKYPATEMKRAAKETLNGEVVKAVLTW